MFGCVFWAWWDKAGRRELWLLDVFRTCCGGYSSPALSWCDSVLGLSCSIVCVTGGSWTERFGHIVVEVPGGGRGVSGHVFTYQVTQLQYLSCFPSISAKWLFIAWTYRTLPDTCCWYFYLMYLLLMLRGVVGFVLFCFVPPSPLFRL